MHKKIKIVYGNSLRVLTLVDKLIGEFYFLLCVILYFSNFLRPLDARGYIAVLFLLRKKTTTTKYIVIIVVVIIAILLVGWKRGVGQQLDGQAG